jgi:hypothetical protein
LNTRMHLESVNGKIGNPLENPDKVISEIDLDATVEYTRS